MKAHTWITRATEAEREAAAFAAALRHDGYDVAARRLEARAAELATAVARSPERPERRNEK